MFNETCTSLGARFDHSYNPLKVLVRRQVVRTNPKGTFSRFPRIYSRVRGWRGTLLECLELLLLVGMWVIRKYMSYMGDLEGGYTRVVGSADGHGGVIVSMWVTLIRRH